MSVRLRRRSCLSSLPVSSQDPGSTTYQFTATQALPPLPPRCHERLLLLSATGFRGHLICPYQNSPSGQVEVRQSGSHRQGVDVYPQREYPLRTRRLSLNLQLPPVLYPVFDPLLQYLRLSSCLWSSSSLRGGPSSSVEVQVVAHTVEVTSLPRC